MVVMDVMRSMEVILFSESLTALAHSCLLLEFASDCFRHLLALARWVAISPFRIARIGAVLLSIESQ